MGMSTVDLNVFAQSLVDSCLVLVTPSFEPGEHIRIETDRYPVLDWPVELALNKPVKALELRDVRKIYISVRELLESLELSPNLW